MSLLLRREPFGLILERTLARFLETRTNRPHEVRWYDGAPDMKLMRGRGQQPWLCNTYLNAIFAPEARPPIFHPIRQEFARSVNRWRRPVQRAYVALATAPRVAGLLAHAGVGISPPLADAPSLLIVAGNHKLRLLDHAGGVVYGIRKSGFPADFMRREVAARQQAAALGLPVPPLEAVAEDGSWFRERYVSGTPINRLDDEAVVRRATAEAMSRLQRLLRQTMREEALDGYAERLAGRARTHLTASQVLGEPEQQGLSNAIDRLLAQVTARQAAGGGRIATALTHGDFQPANLLVNGEGVWLIDWEYAGRRQAGYDALVFWLGARSPRGLAGRLHEFGANGLGPAAANGQPSWPGALWHQADGRRLQSALFLLEELALRLEENANPQLVRPDEGLAVLGREVAEWVGEGEKL